MTNTETVSTERLEELIAFFAPRPPGLPWRVAMDVETLLRDALAARTQSPAEWQVEAACDAFGIAKSNWFDRGKMTNALRAASASIPAPERSKVGVREILQAVAHIGVDFGYGPYVLEEKFTKAARELLEASPDPMPVTITDEMAERAIKAAGHNPFLPENMRAALTAALSVKPGEQR